MSAALCIPRELCEDLVIFSDLDDNEPYSLEAADSPAALAGRLREVLLAGQDGDIEIDVNELGKVLSSLEEFAPAEVQSLARNLESIALPDLDELPQLLDDLVLALSSCC